MRGILKQKPVMVQTRYINHRRAVSWALLEHGNKHEGFVKGGVWLTSWPKISFSSRISIPAM